MSGTSTVTSETILQPQLRRQPSSYSAWVMWLVGRHSSSPDTSFTRHLPQEPLPEQGASMATLASRATSSRLESGGTDTTTSGWFSKVKVT